MIFVVDRIEDDIVVLEDDNSKEICDVDIKKLPKDIEDGAIIRLINGIYVRDYRLERERRNDIEDLFEMLRKN